MSKRELGIRASRLRKAGLATYTEYIQSAAWKATRARFYNATTSRTCVVCESADGLLLHHKTYVRLGAEHLDDLQLLCAKCHRMVHALTSRGDISLGGAMTLVSAARAENAQAERQRRTVARQSERAAWNEQHWLIRLRDMQQEAVTKRVDVRRDMRLIRHLIDTGRPENHIERRVVHLRERLDQLAA